MQSDGLSAPAPPQLDLSVVIPCRNGAHVIGEQLSALAGQNWPGAWEIVVVDNGSTDGTVSVVRQFQKRLPMLRLVRAAGRRGAAHARNAGVGAARANAIAFCDADDRVGAHWLRAMGEALKHRPFVAARLDITELNPPRIAETVNNPQSDGLQRVDYPPHFHHASGATLGVQRAAHRAVGGFDEELPYLEDTDYCLRLQRQGFPLTFVPEAVIHYRFKDRPQELFNQARHWSQYNALMYKRYGQHIPLDHPWRRHLSRWRALIQRLPSLRRQQQRLNWVKTFGTQVGSLEGSLRYRVPPIVIWLACTLAPIEHLSPLRFFIA